MDRTPLSSRDVRNKVQHRRLVQVVSMCVLVCLAGILISGPWSASLLAVAELSLLPVLWLLFQQRAERATSLFLWILTLTICGLLLINNAIHEPVVMAFPVVLVYAALFGKPTMYFKLLSFMLLFVTALCSAIMFGYWLPTEPAMTWTAMLVSLLVLTATGFTVRIIATDFRRLLISLDAENQQVRASEKRLTELAHFDALTGLYRRPVASELFEMALQHQPLALLLLDLDHFKPINDALGHSTGDAVLQLLSQRIRDTLDEGEFACRFGGDEFVLVLKAATIPQQRLNNLLQLCQQEIMVDQYPLRLSASIGVCLAPEHGNNFTELCRKADLAMYRAKAEGRNHWFSYQDSLDQEQHSTLKLITLLRQALQQGQIKVTYQPKINLQTDIISGVEALMQWDNPELGKVSPSRFIPIAEETGLIDELGLFVLRQACMQGVEWLDQGWPLTIAVNVSGRQLRAGTLPAQVQQVLLETGFDAQYLQIELTESTLIGDHQHIEDQLQQLSIMGVSLAIDDFGTGYSNLQYLSRFAAGTLKIDQTFIRNLPEKPQNLALVRGILRLADSLHLATVAEGIEDDDSRALLQQLGCDEGQGFWWSKPLHAAELTQALQQGRWGAIQTASAGDVRANSTPSN